MQAAFPARLRCTASSGGLPGRRSAGRPSQQAPSRLPRRPSDKPSLPSSLAGLAAAAAQFGLPPQVPPAAADDEAQQVAAPGVAAGGQPVPCTKKLSQQTWDVTLAALSVLLVLTCCPLGLLCAAALSLGSLLLDALCQVVVTCQLDPLYTLFGPLTFGVMRWMRSGSVRHAVGAVHGTAKRMRRLARVVLRSLQQRGLQGLQGLPRLQ